MKNSIKILLTLISLTIYLSMYKPKKESNYEIRFHYNHGAIGLLCDNDCSWTDLYIRKKSFYINEHGMVDIKSDLDALKQSTFLFSVEKKGNKIHLKSLKGSDWEDLSFIIPRNKNNSIVVNSKGIEE
ncbi:hypothetical protein P8625_14345 [Tenacibaculum tangerinum]|uniref:Uncharacterized protein n=1 Tax=Tenacibaculum tangerinum TaxID=3038772 RepID=A0ABY8L193_9FLAO|nr:hypothetical protein [Tenacibaculum tangerinum]WGH75237.1 hypothetical protein P8625_14345 [Tenacibaculum tangerinum]